MTFWLVDTSGVTGALPEAELFISMPEYNDRDWSGCRSSNAIKHQLQKEDELLPPESLDRLAQTIWGFVGKIEKEDMMCVVEKQAGKVSRICFAEVVGNVFYDADNQLHKLPVKWFKETASGVRLKPYKASLIDADEWPNTIGDKKLNLAMRNYLPLPGNRFAKWAGILLILFVVVKLTRMYGRM